MLMSSPAHAIFGGKDVSSNDPFARYGVAIHIQHEGGGWSTCSGVLIRSDIVVTAGHCAQGKKENLHVIFFWSIDNAPKSQMRRVSDIAIYDGYKFASNPTPGDSTDIALLKLDKAAPSSARQMQLPDVNLDIREKQRVWIAGYGARSYSKSTKESEGADRVLRVAEIAIYSFDGSATYSAHGQIITFNQSLKSGMCSGDSGGPAYIENDSKYIVLGTAIDDESYDNTDERCTGWSHYIDLRRKVDWIDKVTHDWGVPNDSPALEAEKSSDDGSGPSGQCIVADPTGTPLNIRTAPLGDLTGQTLSNGEAVDVLSSAQDGKGKWWANIGEGYVYAPYLRCDPSTSHQQPAATESPAAKSANNSPHVVGNGSDLVSNRAPDDDDCRFWTESLAYDTHNCFKEDTCDDLPRVKRRLSEACNQ
ncbi:hypothetical protein Q9L58_010733 [Maublancomyces gigas]|uniref:Peptidase S1 domain-containing protein n=1 Tax=Discina gigas TaxID=1032678 RepID=A0ABR3G3B1_9PEZI